MRPKCILAAPEIEALIALLAKVLRDAESSFLAFNPAAGGALDAIGHSITYPLFAAFGCRAAPCVSR